MQLSVRFRFSFAVLVLWIDLVVLRVVCLVSLPFTHLIYHGVRIVIVALSVVLWLRPHGAHLLRHHRLLHAVHSFSPPRPPHVSLNGFMTLNTTNKTIKSILQGTEPRHAPCREGRVSPRQIVDQKLGVHNCSQTVFIMC